MLSPHTLEGSHMIWCKPVRDRRGAYRPSNGDRKLCPRCGTLSFEFSDRYRLPGPTGAVMSTPAWACDRTGCGHSEAVRRPAGIAARIEPRRLRQSTTLRVAVQKKTS